MNTDFMQSRTVRRIMKREGDHALAVVLGALSCIYADEGYYVKADDLFYEDLADGLFSQEATDVRRVVERAVEVGFFHAGLFAEHGILTSNEIQRQFLFSTKKRGSHLIDPRYLLLNEEELAGIAAPGKKLKTAKSGTESTQNRLLSPKNNDLVHLGTQSIAQQSTEQHSKAEKSIEQQTTAYGDWSSPGSDGADRWGEKERGEEAIFTPRKESADTSEKRTDRLTKQEDAFEKRIDRLTEQENVSGKLTDRLGEQTLLSTKQPTRLAATKTPEGGKNYCSQLPTEASSPEDRALHQEQASLPARAKDHSDAIAVPDATTAKIQPKQRELTAAYLQSLTPPNDGQRHNLSGLLDNLNLFQVPLSEQYAIILKSRFGLIGHPVWKGFCTLRESRGKIRFPGRYLLSL